MSELGPSPYADPPPFQSPFGGSFSPPPPPRVDKGIFELRPLSLGEILDRTFALYRRRFWLYTGLSAIPAAISTLNTFLRLSLFLAPQTGTNSLAQVKQAVGTVGIYFVSTLIYLCAYSVTQSATISAISSVYLGEETTIGKALNSVRKHWVRYILIVLWQSLSAMWLPFVLFVPAVALMAIANLRWAGGLLLFLVFPSLAYGVIAYIRNSLGIAAATVENLKVRAAMRRSKVLVAGHKGRVLAILLLMIVLSMVAAVVLGISGAMVGISHGLARGLFESLALLLTFIATSLLGPVGAIALCLFYIDERVRKEGFDVELLMLRSTPASGVESLPSPFTSELA